MSHFLFLHLSIKSFHNSFNIPYFLSCQYDIVKSVCEIHILQLCTCALREFSYFKLICFVSFNFSQWFVRSPWVSLGCYLAFFSSILAYANFVSTCNSFEMFHFCRHPHLLAKCQHCTWWRFSLPYKFLGAWLSEQIVTSPPCCLWSCTLRQFWITGPFLLRCLHQALLIIFLNWTWQAVIISICFRCCWILSSLELNSLFWLKHLITNLLYCIKLWSCLFWVKFFIPGDPSGSFWVVLIWRMTVYRISCNRILISMKLPPPEL